MSLRSSPLPSAPLFMPYPLAAQGSRRTLAPTADWALEALRGQPQPQDHAGSPLLTGPEQVHARSVPGLGVCPRQQLVLRSGQYFTEHPRSPELATAARRE